MSQTAEMVFHPRIRHDSGCDPSTLMDFTFLRLPVLSFLAWRCTRFLVRYCPWFLTWCYPRFLVWHDPRFLMWYCPRLYAWCHPRFLAWNYPRCFAVRILPDHFSMLRPRPIRIEPHPNSHIISQDES